MAAFAVCAQATDPVNTIPCPCVRYIATTAAVIVTAVAVCTQAMDPVDTILCSCVCYRATTAAVIVAALTVYTQATDQDPFYEILSSWQDNFKANFCITAPQDLYGWKLKLKFKAPVSSLQVGRNSFFGLEKSNMCHNIDLWKK